MHVDYLRSEILKLDFKYYSTIPEYWKYREYSEFLGIRFAEKGENGGNDGCELRRA